MTADFSSDERLERALASLRGLAVGGDSGAAAKFSTGSITSLLSPDLDWRTIKGTVVACSLFWLR